MNTAYDGIRILSVLPSGALVAQGHLYYTDDRLTVKTTIQPTVGNDKSVMKEFYDSDGRLVAQRQFGSMGESPLTTYYVYDELGRQRYVIPPSVEIRDGATLPDELAETCFYTEYDEYGRVSKKYVPGASPVTYLYDRRGRLAMSQDGEQAKTGEWSFTKYDIHDRPVMTGVYHSAATYEDHKAALAAQTVFGETCISPGLHGYMNVCYPTAIAYADVLTVQYYDDYQAVSSTHDYQQAYAVYDTKTDRTKGLLTVTKSKVLDSQASTPQWLTTVNYYDENYRVIQSIGDLYPGGREIVSNGYDYSGNPTGVWLIQETAAGWQEYEKWFDYDRYGRLLATHQSILGDAGAITVANYTYDALGRTKQKKLHNGTAPVAYSYNMTGASTGSSSSLFSYRVYSNYSPYHIPPRYDGKPVFFAWGRSDGGGGYRYSYDGFGQIEQAQYMKLVVDFGAEVDDPGFTERDINYDRNGNILHLLRTDDTGGTLHDLSFTYRGNQIAGLDCNGQHYDDYTYDANGNLTYDALRGTTISYNSLNLPEEIIANNGNIRYIYSADGAKLASVADGSFTYYRSTMVYGGTAGTEQLQYVMHPEGVATKRVSGGFDWQYHLTDYMGNVRTVALADVNGLVSIQSTDYYAFGLAHGYENLHLNRYLFSGKEIQDAAVGNMGFLGLYDYGARFYDPLLGRWHNIDPALQTTNPYLFCGNAPMVYVDEDGEFFFLIAAIVIGAYLGGVQQSGNWNPVDWDWGSAKTWAGMAVGAAAGAVGYGVGAAAMGAFAAPGTGAAIVQGGAISGAVSGAAGGGAAGMMNGSGQAWLSGADFWEGMGAGAIQAGIGIATGGIMGGTISGISSVIQGNNFWTGVATTSTPTASSASLNTNGDNNHSVYKGYDEEGVERYVGRTGRDPEIRFKEHARDIGSGRENLKYVVEKSGMTLEESRITEQNLINQLGGPDGGQLLNKINSVAPAKWDAMGISPVSPALRPGGQLLVPPPPPSPRPLPPLPRTYR